MQTAMAIAQSRDLHDMAAATTARLTELGADALWVVYHDYAGLGRAKAVPRGRFDAVAREGVTFAMANWDLAITDEQVPHPVFGADSGDFRAVPDPDTLVAVPHRPGVAQAFPWLTDDAGRPWDGDPRAVLATQVERLRRLGIAVRVAFEAEFVIVPGTDPSALRDDTSRMFTVEGLDARWPLAARILDDLDATGIAVHQFAKEYGPGQFEVSLLPAEPLVAVDRFLLARQLIRAAARDMGATASFMPKPFDDLPGTGCMCISACRAPTIQPSTSSQTPTIRRGSPRPPVPRSPACLPMLPDRRLWRHRPRTPPSACCPDRGRRPTSAGRSATGRRSSACRGEARGGTSRSAAATRR